VKGTVRIISGTLRGKVIPFLNSRYGDADITSQKVKGALFSMLGEHLNGKVFVDLFSGSGQIGVEALSRGADLVVFNESDRSRFRFIKDFADAIRTENNSIILNMMAEDALKIYFCKGY
jgi:16S rRNA (guanine(966)-N(2))-methyltransferase RsmD